MRLIGIVKRAAKQRWVNSRRSGMKSLLRCCRAGGANKMGRHSVSATPAALTTLPQRNISSSMKACSVLGGGLVCGAKPRKITIFVLNRHGVFKPDWLRHRQLNPGDEITQ